MHGIREADKISIPNLLNIQRKDSLQSGLATTLHPTHLRWRTRSGGDLPSQPSFTLKLLASLEEKNKMKQGFQVIDAIHHLLPIYIKSLGGGKRLNYPCNINIGYTPMRGTNGKL